MRILFYFILQGSVVRWQLRMDILIILSLNILYVDRNYFLLTMFLNVCV